MTKPILSATGNGYPITLYRQPGGWLIWVREEDGAYLDPLTQQEEEAIRYAEAHFGQTFCLYAEM